MKRNPTLQQNEDVDDQYDFLNQMLKAIKKYEAVAATGVDEGWGVSNMLDNAYKRKWSRKRGGIISNE